MVWCKNARYLEKYLEYINAHTLKQKCIKPPTSHEITEVTPLKRGQLKKLKISKFTDFDEIRVYIGVIDHAESKSGLIIELGLLLHYHFGYFC